MLWLVFTPMLLIGRENFPFVVRLTELDKYYILLNVSFCSRNQARSRCASKDFPSPLKKKKKKERKKGKKL